LEFIVPASGCQEFIWELLDVPGEEPRQFTLSGKEAENLFSEAKKEAIAVNLPWLKDIPLTPSPELLQLVARSQNLAVHQAAEGGE